jgi:hypothetical protein
VRRGHQGQLVERQWPGRTSRDGEGHPRDAALFEVVQQRAEAACVARSLDGHAPGEGGRRLGADREQEHLVVERAPVPQEQLVSLRPDGLHAREMHRGALVARDAHQVVPLRLAEAERLRDRQWPVGPFGRGCDQLDLDPLLGQAAQRDHRLERGHSAAHDRDCRLVLAHAIRIDPEGGSGIGGSRPFESVISRRG